MAQYQSFPDAPGDSRTLDKLKALRLPALAGKRFLDIGCNEGFFCGFAQFEGAAAVVGIDRSPLFIERARARFAGCQFLQQGWEQLPDGPFDVILLASALHYADDQPDLIRRLVERLSADGVLVLELGIAASDKAEWRTITRGIDERLFPSMLQLRQTLADYAWKWVGKSINQDGDPVGRHVLHISRRRPLAYLLMQPPGYGKSSIAARLAPALPVVSGDEVLSRIAAGKLEASPQLAALVAGDFSPFTLDVTIRRVFEQQCAAELVALWLAQVQGADFVFDGYVPAEYQKTVSEQLVRAGYLPVQLQWERAGAAQQPLDWLQQRADAYYHWLADPADVAATPAQSIASQGCVDEIHLQEGGLLIRGWAVESNGRLPEQLQVRLGSQRQLLPLARSELRHDVQRHLQLPHALLGFCVFWPQPEPGEALRLARKRLEVSLPAGKTLYQAADLVQRLVRSAGDGPAQD